MAVQLIGKGYQFGLATLAFGVASIAGYISPKFETLSLTHQADFNEEMDQTGVIDSLWGNPRGVECQFRFKPRGSTIQNAWKSMSIPQVCAAVTITGLKAPTSNEPLAFGGFTDVLNTDGSNTQPWIYIGTGSVDPTFDGPWTATITLRRYLGITSGTLIVA